MEAPQGLDQKQCQRPGFRQAGRLSARGERENTRFGPAQYRYWQARKNTLTAVADHYKKATDNLDEVLKQRLADPAGEQAVLQAVQQVEKLPANLAASSAVPQLLTEGEAFMNQHRDEGVDFPSEIGIEGWWRGGAHN